MGVLAYFITALLFGIITASAQDAELVLRLRTQRGHTFLAQHPTTRSLHFYTQGNGHHILDTSTFTLTPVEGGYHTQYDIGGGFAVGAFGSLLFSEYGQEWVVRVFDSTDRMNSFTQFRGVADGGFLTNFDEISVNDGNSFFTAGPLWHSVGGPVFGLGLLVDTTGEYVRAAHRSSTSSSVQTAIRKFKSGINVAEKLYFSAFAQDSLMWFLRSSTNVDTICRAKLGELTCECDTLIAGKSPKVLFLHEDGKGNVLYIDTSGHYARYSEGRWTWQPKQLPLHEEHRSTNYSYVSRSHCDIAISVSGSDRFGRNSRSFIVKIPFERYDQPDIDTLRFRETNLRTVGTEGMISIDNFWIRPNGDAILIESLLGGMQNLMCNSILTGTTTKAGIPLATSYSDVLFTPAGHHVAKGVETKIRNFPVVNNVEGSPPLQNVSMRGIMPPYRSNDGIIFPGSNTSWHNAEGYFERFMRKGPSTVGAITGRRDTIIGTEDAILFINRLSGKSDTIDLTGYLGENLDTIGYVSHILLSNDTTWFVAVSSRNLYDTSSDAVVPYEVGGFLRTTDGGTTWSRIQLPISERYVVSALAESSSTFFLSLTDCVVDTSIHDTRASFIETSESQTTQMSNRVILRSTDGGLTWSEVHRSNCHTAMRMVGGYGVQADNGTLIMPVADDLFESKDNGLTWDFHASVPIEYPVVSVFKHPDGGPVYYCTEGGLFKKDLATGIDEHTVDADERKFFVVSAEPHILGSQLNVHVANVQSAVGGVRTIRVVDLLGNTVVDLKPLLDLTNPQQDIPISVATWPRGVYYLIIQDHRRGGTINLIKIQ